MAEICVYHKQSVHKVTVSPKAKMNSNNTLNALRNGLARSLGIGREFTQDVELEVRSASSSSASSSSSLIGIEMTAEEFAQGHALVVDAISPIRGIVAQFDEMKERLLNVEQSLQQQKELVGILASDSQAYQADVLRHVVNIAHTKLQRRFGAQPVDQSWADYLNDARQHNPQYFLDCKLLPCFNLLGKGPSTPFQEGNEATHQPAAATVERTIASVSEQQPEWQCMWNYVRIAD